MNGFKVTVIGTDNTNFNTSTVLKSTLDAQADVVSNTFDVLGIYLTQNDDIETTQNLNGRQVITKKVNYEQFNIELVYKTFMQQTPTATYTANRFNYDLLKKKYHFLFFHNATSEINDYPYLSYFLNSTTVKTHALQVVFLGKSAIEKASNLNKWNLSFETAYPLT